MTSRATNRPEPHFPRVRYVCVSLTIGVLSLVLFAVAPAKQTAPPSSIVTGKLDYRVSWNGISAASATVNVARVDDGPAPQYHVEAAVQTSWLVDLLWSLRGRVTADFTTGDFTPLGFRY